MGTANVHTGGYDLAHLARVATANLEGVKDIEEGARITNGEKPDNNNGETTPSSDVV